MHLQIVKETKFYKAFCENGSPQPFTFLDATAFSFARWLLQPLPRTFRFLQWLRIWPFPSLRPGSTRLHLYFPIFHVIQATLVLVLLRGVKAEAYVVVCSGFSLFPAPRFL